MAEAGFPRGGSGPPEPLPRGASVALLAISLATLVGVLALLSWILL